MSFFKNKHITIKNSGFTLVELLVVVAIMAVIAGISADLFVSILKGANKATVMNEIKQNGNYILDIMERNIRNAKSISLVDPHTIILEDITGQYIRFKIYSPDLSDLSNKINGKITIASGVDIGTFSDEKSLTNTDSISGASIQSDSYFSLVSPTPPNENPSSVSIYFRILQGEDAPSRQDYKIGGTGLVFQTTVSLRTY